jgi:hypothetical protein
MSIPRFTRSHAPRLTVAFFACLLLFPTMLIAADEKPATKVGDTAVCAVRHQTLKGFTYFYKGTDTTFDGIKETVEKIIPELHKALTEGKIDVRGPIVFIYHGIAPDPKAKFQIEIGMPVDEGTKPAGDFKVRDVTAYHCNSVLYSGALSGIHSAFEKLYTDAPPNMTDEAREMYLYFEKPESPNNVVHVSLGTKE